MWRPVLQSNTIKRDAGCPRSRVSTPSLHPPPTPALAPRDHPLSLSLDALNTMRQTRMFPSRSGRRMPQCFRHVTMVSRRRRAPRMVPSCRDGGVSTGVVATGRRYQVSRTRQVMRTGAFWGTDFILLETLLKNRASLNALAFAEILSLKREDFFEACTPEHKHTQTHTSTQKHTHAHTSTHNHHSPAAAAAAACRLHPSIVPSCPLATVAVVSCLVVGRGGSSDVARATATTDGERAGLRARAGGRSSVRPEEKGRVAFADAPATAHDDDHALQRCGASQSRPFFGPRPGRGGASQSSRPLSWSSTVRSRPGAQAVPRGASIRAARANPPLLHARHPACRAQAQARRAAIDPRSRGTSTLARRLPCAVGEC